MTGLERIAMIYYMLAAVSLVVGIWWGHAITIRSWVSWWSDVGGFLREQIRAIVREELERHTEEAMDKHDC